MSPNPIHNSPSFGALRNDIRNYVGQRRRGYAKFVPKVGQLQGRLTMRAPEHYKVPAAGRGFRAWVHPDTFWSLQQTEMLKYGVTEPGSEHFPDRVNTMQGYTHQFPERMRESMFKDSAKYGFVKPNTLNGTPLDDLMLATLRGEWSSVPHLDYNAAVGRVQGHEGRHRAAVASALGVQAMPLDITTFESKWRGLENTSFVKDYHVMSPEGKAKVRGLVRLIGRKGGIIEGDPYGDPRRANWPGGMVPEWVSSWGQ